VTVPATEQQSRESGQTLKLVTNGRLTGIPHVVELRYALVGGSFFLLAGNPNSDWAMNALASKEARLKIGERAYRVVVMLASTAQRSQILDVFHRKYGSRIVNQWYGNARVCLRLDVIGQATERAVRGEVDAETSFTQWKKLGADYYQSVVDAFDSASEEYDYTISRNYINNWIRKRSINEIRKLVTQDDLLLEIGCGTGAEAIELSRYVRGIVATDISDKMLTILKKKAIAKRLETKIFTVRLRASQVVDVQPFLPKETVRVAYSLNGALNCEPELDRVPGLLSRIISTNGYFVCSIRNTLCLPETISHSLVLQLDKLNTRKNQPTMVSVGGMDIPSLYYPPNRFVHFFHPFFRVKKIIGLPAFMPPAYLNDYYLQTGILGHLLQRLETILGDWFPFNRFGDQTLFVLQRR